MIPNHSSRFSNRFDLRVIVLCFATLGCIAVGGASRAIAFDWPVIRGNVQGTAVSDSKFPVEPDVLWEFKTGGEQEGFEGTPVIADGKVFAGDFKGNVYAIDLKTGKEVWRAKTKDGIVTAGACMHGKLVIGDFGGGLYCFQTSDGKPVWSLETDLPITSGPTFVGNDVLVSTDAGSLSALDLETGKSRWNYPTGDNLRSTACVWKKYALLGGCDSRLHKIDLEKGDSAGGGVALMAPTLSTPNIIGDYAIVPTQTGVVLNIKIETGEIVWTYSPDPSLNTDIRSSSATLATVVGEQLQGVVVVASRNRRLLCLDAADGQLRWETILRKRSDSAPLICDGRAWIGASDGMVYGISLETGKETWSYQLSGQILACPAVSDNRLIIATEKGTIVCFGDPKAK